MEFLNINENHKKYYTKLEFDSELVELSSILSHLSSKFIILNWTFLRASSRFIVFCKSTLHLPNFLCMHPNIKEKSIPRDFNSHLFSYTNHGVPHLRFVSPFHLCSSFNSIFNNMMLSLTTFPFTSFISTQILSL